MKHFLIAGNTRVGSTWIETSLDLLPGIGCRREVKWKMPYQETLAVHTYIRASTTSMKETIASACDSDRLPESGSFRAKGSKLKFDPYGFVDASAFSTLARIIEDDIIVILLRRCYVDIFKTWKIIGIRHVLNEASASRIAQSDPVLVEAVRPHSAAATAARDIQLVHHGKRLATPKAYNRETPLDYPLPAAIDDLLVLFYNDIHALQATAHVTNRYVVPYTKIGCHFRDLAIALGANASFAEIDHALANPLIRKIEAEDHICVRPEGFLETVAAALDAAFARCVDGTLRPNDLVAHDQTTDRIIFRIPGFGATLAALEDRIGDKIHWDEVETAGDVWNALQPIYRPEL